MPDTSITILTAHCNSKRNKLEGNISSDDRPLSIIGAIKSSYKNRTMRHCRNFAVKVWDKHSLYYLFQTYKEPLGVYSLKKCKCFTSRTDNN